MTRQHLAHACALVILAALPGCEGRTLREHKPVLGPPPPRVTQSDSGNEDVGSGPSMAGLSGEDSTVIRTSYDSRQMLDPDLSGTQVVALVNGQPLFADDILTSRYGSKLEQASQKYSADEMQRLRRSLIQRHLEEDIERELLVQALRSTLKIEQLEALEAQIDDAFPKYLDFVMGRMGVSTRAELEDRLAVDGTTLASLQQSFANQQMAIAYLSSKAEVSQEISREDLLAWYREHIEEYEVPARVKWQQIVVRYEKHGGESGAKQKTQQIIDELKGGADFAEVASRHSDGATAADGGVWDWTQRGSLADARVEDLLFELPVNAVSDVIVGNNKFEIVLVVERRDEGRIPFEEVQHKIETQLRQDVEQAARQKVLDEVRSAAGVVTIFDDDITDDA